MTTLAKLRRAMQGVLDNDLHRTGSESDGHIGSKDLLPLAAAIGELVAVKTDWVVEYQYPHWDAPMFAHREEHPARSLAVHHHKHGAKVRLSRQEFYAGLQEEVAL